MILPILREANMAFASAMPYYGFAVLHPSNIDKTGRRIREEITIKNTKVAAVIAHT